MGLRVQLFPTTKDPSPSFKTTWEKVLTQCSLDLMKTLINQYTIDMVSLDSGIDRLNVQYQHLMDVTAFADKWKEVRTRLEGLNKDIIMKKQAKFVKDKLAFSEGYAYKWADRPLGRRGPLRGQVPMRPTIANSESDSSISSSRSFNTGTRPPGSSSANATRKRLRRTGNTPPTAPRKGKKTSTTHQSAHTPGEPSPEANSNAGMNTPVTTLHHTISKALGSTLINPKKALLDLDFLDLTKQLKIDTFIRKAPSTPLPATPLPNQQLLQPI